MDNDTTLIGRKVNKVFVNGDQNVLVLDTDKGLIGWQTIGDCCSETWFADILGLHSWIGHVIVDTDELETQHDVEDGRSRQDIDDVYGFQLKTMKGTTDIIYRNSSNGYYGGWMSGIDVTPDDLKDMEEITTDEWKA